jgi:hypothetical protein
MKEIRQVLLLLAAGALCASCATRMDPLGLPTAPLPDRKVERIIRRLDKLEYPMDLTALCNRIGLNGGYLFGRTLEEKDPPFEWLTITHFHPRYGLKYKFIPKEVNERQQWIIYEMKIWKKEEPDEDL